MKALIFWGITAGFAVGIALMFLIDHYLNEVVDEWL